MGTGTAAETVSRWARRFVLASVGFFVLFAAIDLVDPSRRVAVVFGLLGFVFHTVFGKAYSLVPSYFDRELAAPRLMPVHLAATGVGTVLLATAALSEVELPFGFVGAVAWCVGVAVFLGNVVWSIRDNLVGSETGTGDANADRRPVDRLANAFVPVALAYLVVGSYGLLAHDAGLPGPFAYFPRISHLLAAGAAALMLFAVGFRLLPRFLVVPSPRYVPWIVLPAGATGPALLAIGLGGSTRLYRTGALLQTVAILGFAGAYVAMFARSDRRRVGLYGALAGVLAGSVGVLFGLQFALVGIFQAGVPSVHLRLNVIGFLGLAIVGVAYQFYPPNVGTFRFGGNATALRSIAAIAGGLGLQACALFVPKSATTWPTGGIGPVAAITFLGRSLVLLGALAYAYLLVRLFRERYGNRS